MRNAEFATFFFRISPRHFVVKQLLKQRASWKKEKVDEETPRWDNWISGGSGGDG
jgi:hypothetical protein